MNCDERNNHKLIISELEVALVTYLKHHNTSTSTILSDVLSSSPSERPALIQEAIRYIKTQDTTLCGNTPADIVLDALRNYLLFSESPQL